MGKKNKNKSKKSSARSSVSQVPFRNGTSGPGEGPSGCEKTPSEPTCAPRIQRQESFLRRMLNLTLLSKKPKTETSEASTYKTASARSPLTSTTDSFSDSITLPATASDSTLSILSKSAKRKQRLLKTVQIKAELNATNSPVKGRSNCAFSFLCPSRNLDDLNDLVDTVANTEQEEEERIAAMRQINDTVKSTEDFLKRICLRMFLADWGIDSVLCESGVDAGDLAAELRVYRDAERSDNLSGDKNASRSAIELLRNVVDKHRKQADVVMDALELMLVLDSERLPCLPALIRDLQNGRKELPSPAPSDPQHNSTDPLRLDTSASQTDFDRNANALKPETNSDNIDNSTTGQHSYSIVLKAPTAIAPIRAPPPPPPPSSLPSVKAPPPPPPPPFGLTTPKTSFITVPSTPVCRPPPPPPPPPAGLTSTVAAPLSRCAPPPPPPPPGMTPSSRGAPMMPTTPLSSRNVPPPPPPPPPPGALGVPVISISGPPPPPPPPGMSMSPGLTPKPVKSEEFYPKSKKTCPIRWAKINHHNIQDVSTVWSDYSRPDFSTSERMDLEAMFEVTEVKTPLSRLGSMKKKVEQEETQEAHLDANRTLALEILLARFKAPSEEVVAKLESGMGGVFSTDLLTSLLQAFPTPEEVEPFLAMEVPPSGKANRLCWEMARKPQLKLRVELLVAGESLPSEVTQRLDDCKNLTSAFEMLRGETVLRVLHKCLQCGNFVNQGSTMAHAAGFRLTSLPDLLNIKAKNLNGPRRFVDFLVRNMDIEESDVDEVLESLSAFTKLSSDDLLTEQERLSKSLTKLKSAVEKKGDDGLLQIYKGSLESSEKEMDRLAGDVATLRQTEKEILAYFCADKSDTMAAIASTLSTAFKSIGEALKLMKSPPLTRSQSMMSLTRSASLLDNTPLGSLRRDDLTRLSLRRKTPARCPSREQLTSIFLNTPNRH